MPDFFEAVFAAQASPPDPPPRKRRRRRGDGLSGSGRRYAVLLAMMVSLTAVPTWIMLRAGVQGLDQHASVTVQPLLRHEQPVATPPAPQPVPSSAVDAPQPPRPVRPAVPVPPAAQPEPRVPILERHAVVDTSPSRPVRTKPAKPGKRPKPTSTPADPSPTDPGVTPDDLDVMPDQLTPTPDEPSAEPDEPGAMGEPSASPDVPAGPPAAWWPPYPGHADHPAPPVVNGDRASRHVERPTVERPDVERPKHHRAKRDGTRADDGTRDYEDQADDRALRARS